MGNNCQRQETVAVTVLGSGSGGNATVIRCRDAALLVDAGFSAVELARRLAAADVDPAAIVGVTVSHEHNDHVQALRVFCKRHGGIRAYMNMLTAERLQTAGKAPADIVVFANGTPFEVGPFRIEAFSVSHDAIDPVGFVVHCAGRRIGVVTDFGHAGKMVPLKLRNAHVLVVESNHDPELLRQCGRPPRVLHRIRGKRGHLSNDSSMDLLRRVVGDDTQHLILAHLSVDCNRPGLVEKSVRACLAALGRPDLEVQIAAQDVACRTVTV